MSADDGERSLDEIFRRFGEGEEAAARSRVPFKFLDPYEAEDRDIFFGRYEETRELYRKYFSSSLLLIYGESGTGKTSLLRCGLLSQIPSSDVQLIHIRNSAAPFDALAMELRGALGWRYAPGSTVLDQLRELYKARRKPITLLFDQLEELFIFQDEEPRASFLVEAALWLASSLPLKLVFVIRQEYLAFLTEFETALPGLFQNRVWVRKMDALKAQEAIEGPCRVCGVGIETQLVQKLVRHLQAEGREVELPDMQVLMDRLYRRAVERDKSSPGITLEDYEQLGRFENILADFLAEQVFALPAPELARTVLNLMVSAEGTKRAVKEKEAVEALSSTREGATQEPPFEGTIEAIFQALERARILRLRVDGAYELRHDALAKTIFAWMSELERELAEIRQLLINRHDEYRKRGTRLDGDTLELIRPYLRRLALPAEVLDFFEECERSHRERTRLREEEEARTHQARYLLSQARVNLESGKAPAYLAASLRARPLEEARGLANTILWDVSGEEAVGQQVLPGHTDDVSCVALSPSGSHAASASKDGTVRLWDLSSGEGYVLQGHGPPSVLVEFSPDGTFLAGTSDEKDLCLWDLTTGLPRVLRGHEARISAFAISRGSKTIASAAIDGRVRVWEAASGVCRVLRGQEGRITSCAFSADGAFFATASRGGSVFIWDAMTGEPTALREFSGEVACVSFSPRGDVIATSGPGEPVRLWDWRAGAHKSPRGSDPYRGPLAFSPDGALLACSSGDGGNIGVWDLSYGRLKVLKGHQGTVTHLAFSPRGALLASGSWDRTVRLWDAGTGSCRTLRGHEDHVQHIAFSRDGLLLASGSRDRTVRLWRLQERVFPVLAGHSGRVDCVAFSRDGARLATGASDKTIRLWDVNTLASRVLRGSEGAINRLAFSPDGKMVASASPDRTVKLWELPDGEVRFVGRHEGGVNSVAFSPDGTRIATASDDRTVRLWGVEAVEARALKGHDREVQCASFSPDGAMLASGSKDGIIRLWDLSTGESRRLKGLEGKGPSGVRQVAFSPDGSLLASTAWGTPLLGVWDFGGELPRLLQNVDTALYRVAFSPDGVTLVVGTYEGTIAVVDVRTGAARSFSGHEQAVFGVAFSSDGKTLASASMDGTLRLWDAGTGHSRVLKGHAEYAFHAVFSRDGRLLACDSADETACLWRESSGLFPGRGDPIWLVGAGVSEEELAGALDRLTNLRYDPRADQVRPQSFKGLPEDWKRAGE